MLKRNLLGRIDMAGIKAEWDDVLRNLRALAETALTRGPNCFAVWSRSVGIAGTIVQWLWMRLSAVARRPDDGMTTNPPKE